MTEIRIEFDVPAEMRDGTVLPADVYRPVDSGPWPVLLSRLPYGKQMPMAIAFLDPLAAARRGFRVVIQDTRGRFASEGGWERSFPGVGSAYARTDLHFVVPDLSAFRYVASLHMQDAGVSDLAHTATVTSTPRATLSTMRWTRPRNSCTA